MAIVTHVLSDCPGCGAKNSFGNVDVYRTYVYRGCKRCQHNQRIKLPQIKKRVIYLDQFFFSHTFRECESQFMEAADRIAKLANLQLLVVPYSSIHEDETHQWEKREELFSFIKATARGKEFKDAHSVELNQLVKAFKAWLSGDGSDYRIESQDALDDDIHTWDSYFRIEVGRYMGDIELIRDLKQQSIEGLVNLFDGWRTSTTTFEEDLLAEYKIAGKGYIDFYLDFVGRLASGDFSAMLDAPIASTVVQTLLAIMPEDIPQEAQLKKCAEFLILSEHFKRTPCQWIQAHMFATFKHMIKAGSYTNHEKAVSRLSGFFFDVKHIAMYAPYVDAFVMDKPMADLARKPTVDLEGNYGTKIFSRVNWKEFMEWLDQIETEDMTDTHRTGLKLAYPDLK